VDLKELLAELRKEREILNAAISSLERLEYGRHRGPGRPPTSVTKISTNGTNGGYSHPTPAPGEG
jgi:hypothetical protein